MSESWIEGHFEGVYSGPRRPHVDSRTKGDRRRRAYVEPRRFGFEIESGEVHDLTISAPPAAEGIDDDRVIRQARVKRVRLASLEDHEADQETSLFDVHISDWQLKHPAEAGERAYGTIVGTIRARRRPLVIEPPVPATMPAPATSNGPTATTMTSDAPATHGLEPASTPVPKQHRNLSDDRGAISPGPGWAEVLSVVAILFAVGGYACGMRSALLWLAPIASALAILGFTSGGVLRSVPWWLAGILPILQALVIWTPIQLAWQTGCWPALGISQLAMLGIPVGLSAILGARGSLWMTSAIWTLVLCSSCGIFDGSSCGALATNDAPIVADAKTAHRSPQRSDENGRWPVMPPMPVAPAATGVGLSAESRLRARPQLDSNSALGDGTQNGSGTTEGIALAATTGSGGDSEPISLSATGSLSAPLAEPPSPPASPSLSAKPQNARERRLTQVDGGWLSPDHRRAPRELVLISIEQANRTPELFFESGGAHRVYVPTDSIFEDGSSTLRRDAPLVLARVAALLSLTPEPAVLLDVHTDSAGAPESQIELSRRRAASVRSWLLDRGHVSPDRFAMQPMGGGRPLLPPDGDFGAQQPNRRIEIRLVSPE